MFVRVNVGISLTFTVKFRKQALERIISGAAFFSLD